MFFYTTSLSRTERLYRNRNVRWTVLQFIRCQVRLRSGEGICSVWKLHAVFEFSTVVKFASLRWNAARTHSQGSNGMTAFPKLTRPPTPTTKDTRPTENPPVTTVVSASLSLPMCHVLKTLDCTTVPKGLKPSFGGTSGRLLPTYVKNP